MRSTRDRSRFTTALCAYSVMALAFAGCGADDGLREVTGTVNMDGKPLAEAYVQFNPIVTGSEPMRPGYGLTDENGFYSLQFSTNKSGAKPGKYKVLISTHRSAGPGPNGTVLTAAPETVPNVYNSATTLTAEVTEDKRVFDFDLKSSAGKVIQRREMVN